MPASARCRRSIWRRDERRFCAVVALASGAAAERRAGMRCRSHPYLRFERGRSPKTASSPLPRRCACAPKAARSGTASIATFRSPSAMPAARLREVTFSTARRFPRRPGRALPHRAHARLHPHLCRRQGRVDPARRAQLRLSLPYRPAGPLVRRQAGTQLERHRQFLEFPDQPGALSPAVSRATRLSCAGRPSPAGSARAASIGAAASGPDGALTVVSHAAAWRRARG